MKKQRVLVVDGGMGLGAAVAGALAGYSDPVEREMRIELRDEPGPVGEDVRLGRRPKARDWEQRNRKRPRR